MSQEIDYLTEDSEIANQKFVVLSILSPAFHKSPEYAHIRGIKVRGTYGSYEEAQRRADFLQKTDQKHNVFIGEVGKWLPFDDEPDKAIDSTYSEKKLNNLMKAYMENQANAKELYETRKNDLMSQAFNKEEVKDKKDKKKKKKSVKKEETETLTQEVDLEKIDDTLKDVKDEEQTIKTELYVKTSKMLELEAKCAELKKAQENYELLQEGFEKGIKK